MTKSRIGVRDLRNKGGDVLARVQAGEHIIVTKSGKPVAELSPVRHRTLERTMLLARWRNVPAVDPRAMRDDLDALLDPGL